MLKRWPGEGEMQAVHARPVTAVQLEELQLVVQSILEANPRKRKREHQPSKEQLKGEKAELEAIYPIGRKGVISVRRDVRRFPHTVTNHFVKVVRCTPRFVELRECAHRSEVCYQDDRVLLTKVRADWDRSRADSVFGA